MIAPPAGADLVVTTDAVIAGVHFFPDEDRERDRLEGAGGQRVRSRRQGRDAARLRDVASRCRRRRSALGSKTSRKGLRAAQDVFGCQLVGRRHRPHARTAQRLHHRLRQRAGRPHGAPLDGARRAIWSTSPAPSAMPPSASTCAATRHCAQRCRLGRRRARRASTAKFSAPLPAGRAGARRARLRRGGDGHLRRPRQGLRPPVPRLRRRRPHRGAARAAVGRRARRSRRGWRDARSI